MVVAGQQDDSIFVAIAAYREPEIALTIESCIEQARHPDRLRFGVCLQFDDSIPGAGFDALDHLEDRTTLRLVRFPHSQSRGGCWARWVTQSLYDAEHYTLQCDAHSRLGPDWDVDLIAAMALLPSEKPLITGFPPLYDRIDGRDRLHGSAEDPVPMTVIAQWSPAGWIHHPTMAAPDWMPPGPRRARVISGAFVFTLGQWNVEVRQDPEHLYAGEEFALTLRSFTSGYDLWNPPKRMIWHRNHPEPNPKYISDDPDGRQRWRHDRAMRRLRVLLAGDPERILEPYTLGAERTLEDYRVFSGLDCERFEIHPDAAAGIPPDPVTISDR
jgi:hypothetical protein